MTVVLVVVSVEMGEALGSALRASYDCDPASIPEVLASVADRLGGRDIVIYLVDFAQTTLAPLRARQGPLPPSEEIATTMAGRAFLDERPVSATRDDGCRIWVPVFEGSNRAGVLALSVPSLTDTWVECCEQLGVLAGYLIGTHARSTDLYDLFRRRQRLTLAASMQWDLLPPLLLKTRRVSVAALIEPAYDIGGDCFDYALNDQVLELAIFDPVGHGVRSALIAALAIGCYRHDRRERAPLESVHEHLDRAVEDEFPGVVFSTGQLVRLDLESGQMTWTNAGHQLPLLIRGGRVVRQLECEPTLPWGLASLGKRPGWPAAARETLEPGDSVLFYTDGVIEGRSAEGEYFGTQRLVDFVGQVASDLLAPEEIVRRLIGAVLQHQSNQLRDDATFVLVRWLGASQK